MSSSSSIQWPDHFVMGTLIKHEKNVNLEFLGLLNTNSRHKLFLIKSKICQLLNKGGGNLLIGISSSGKVLGEYCSLQDFNLFKIKIERIIDEIYLSNGKPISNFADINIKFVPCVHETNKCARPSKIIIIYCHCDLIKLDTNQYFCYDSLASKSKESIQHIKQDNNIEEDKDLIERLTNDNKQLIERTRISDNINKQLTNDNKQLTEQTRILNNINKQLTEQVFDVNRNNKELIEQASKLGDTNLKLTGQVDKLRNENGRLRDQITGLEFIKSKLSNEKDIIVEQGKSLINYNKQLLQERENLDKKLKLLLTSKQLLEKQLATVNDQKQTTELVLKSAIDQISSAKSSSSSYGIFNTISSLLEFSDSDSSSSAIK